jgi:hypothetical protein
MHPRALHRFVALFLAVLWLFPLFRVATLPPERLAQATQSFAALLEGTEGEHEQAAAAVPAIAQELARSREALASPQVLERTVWKRWLFEVAAVCAGLASAAMLWFQLRYWRSLLSIAAVGAILLSHVPSMVGLLARADSLQTAFSAVRLVARDAVPFFEFTVVPAILALSTLYAVLSASRKGALANGAA